jgi:hypothetical protein
MQRGKRASFFHCAARLDFVIPRARQPRQHARSGPGFLARRRQSRPSQPVRRSRSRGCLGRDRDDSRFDREPTAIVSRHEHVYSWRRVRRVWRQKPSRVEGAPVWVFGEPRVAIVTAPCWSFSGLTSMGPSPVPRKSRARSICARGWIVSSRTQQFKYWISMDSWFNPAMRPKQRRGSSRRRGVRELGFGAVPEVSVSSSCSSNPRPYRVTNRFEPQRANWRLLRLSLIWARCRVI